MKKIIFACTLFLTPQIIWAHDWAREPTVQEVQEMALQSLGSDPSELIQMKRRSRWAAALPKFQVGMDHDLKESMSVSTEDSVQVSGGNVFIGPDSNDLSRDFNSGTGFEVKAVWALDQILFNRDSLAVGVEQRNWNRERNLVASEVAEIYFKRRRYHVQEKDPVEMRLKVDEATAQLDALTGGWFSREIKRRSSS